VKEGETDPKLNKLQTCEGNGVWNGIGIPLSAGMLQTEPGTMANLPNIQNLNDAIRTMEQQGRQMSDSMRAHTAAQDQANAELGRVANFPVAQMQQQLNRVQRTLEDIQEYFHAE
jgi:hypothetical protein